MTKKQQQEFLRRSDRIYQQAMQRGHRLALETMAALERLKHEYEMKLFAGHMRAVQRSAKKARKKS